jgi:hypothetical protein
VSVEGSYLNLKKVVIIKGFPISKYVINVRAFLGFTGYCRRFIPG